MAPSLPSPSSLTLKAGNIPPSTSIERYLMEDLVSNICLTCCSSRKDTVVTLVQQMDRIQQFSLPVLTVEVCKGGWGGREVKDGDSLCSVWFSVGGHGILVGVACWLGWQVGGRGMLVGVASWWA